MAISTKADLKTEASSWADDPFWFADKADNLIALAEARLNRKLKGRLAVVEAPLIGTLDSRNIALPPGYAEPLALWRTTTGCREPLKAYIPSELPYRPSAGTPWGFAVIGSNIVLDCPCDQAHTFAFLYREKFSLADDGDTNWLLANWPDAYLAALMVEVYAFKSGPDSVQMAATWNERMNAAIDDIMQLDGGADALAPLNVDYALVDRRYTYNDLIRGS